MSAPLAPGPAQTVMESLSLATYPSVDVYAALSTGSGLEADFGMMWRIPGISDYWRLSAAAEGDVIAVRNNGARRRDRGATVLLLGVNPEPPAPDTPISTLYDAAERVLAGWADDTTGSRLSWVVAALERAHWRDVPVVRPTGVVPMSLRQLWGHARSTPPT